MERFSQVASMATRTIHLLINQAVGYRLISVTTMG